MPLGALVVAGIAASLASAPAVASRPLPNPAPCFAPVPVISVPHGGRVASGPRYAGCVQELLAGFLARPVPAELDAACVATIERPEFHPEPLQMRAVPVEPSVLAELAGSYSNEEIGLTLEVELDGERLLLAYPGGAVPLVAVAPDRFRIPGLLGTSFGFESDDAGTRYLVLEQPGSPPLRLARP